MLLKNSATDIIQNNIFYKIMQKSNMIQRNVLKKHVCGVFKMSLKFQFQSFSDKYLTIIYRSTVWDFALILNNLLAFKRVWG